jgi:hypothetical protein
MKDTESLERCLREALNEFQEKSRIVGVLEIEEKYARYDANRSRSALLALFDGLETPGISLLQTRAATIEALQRDLLKAQNERALSHERQIELLQLIDRLKKDVLYLKGRLEQLDQRVITNTNGTIKAVLEPPRKGDKRGRVKAHRG